MTSDPSPTQRYYGTIERWRRAICAARLGASAKVVAIVLLHDFINRNHFDDAGELLAFPSQQTLARRTGLTDRSIRRALETLVEAGVIDVAAGSGREPSAYGFRAEWLADAAERVDRPEGGQKTSLMVDKKRPSGWTETVGRVDEDVLRLLRETQMKDPPDARARPERARGGEDSSISSRPRDEEDQAAARRPSRRNGVDHDFRSASAAGTAGATPVSPNPRAASTSTAPAPRPANRASRNRHRSAMTPDEFERFTPSAEDDAWIAEHCGAVKDAHAPSWTEGFRNYWLGDKGRVPPDPHRAFRTYMDYRQQWALKDKAQRSGRKTKLDAALDLARKLNPGG